jgi:hypothetical protein
MAMHFDSLSSGESMTWEKKLRTFPLKRPAQFTRRGGRKLSEFNSPLDESAVADALTL